MGIGMNMEQLIRLNKEKKIKRYKILRVVLGW